VSNDRKIGIVAKGDDQLVNHKSKDTQLGGMAVVELDGALLELLELLLLREGVPAKVNVSVTEVTDEFVSGVGDVLHEGALKDSNECESSSGYGVRAEGGGDTVGVRGEGVAGVVGRWIPARVMTSPRKASWAIPPCLISTWRSKRS
jgi:hypothetical protein